MSEFGDRIEALVDNVRRKADVEALASKAVLDAKLFSDKCLGALNEAKKELEDALYARMGRV
jgi:hypothetical protein